MFPNGMIILKSNNFKKKASVNHRLASALFLRYSVKKNLFSYFFQFWYEDITDKNTLFPNFFLLSSVWVLLVYLAIFLTKIILRHCSFSK